MADQDPSPESSDEPTPLVHPSLRPRRLPEGYVVAKRYRIVRLIAKGGMASVYEARHLELDRVLALKILFPPAEDDEDFGRLMERFQLEARITAAFNHPNIVTIYDYGVFTEGGFFLAMEYCEGQRLDELLKDGPLEPRRAVRLLLQMCDALEYTHQRKTIHRDIKLSNVIIQKTSRGEDRVKILDFGLLKREDRPQELTNHGVVMGSPHFMAPEQITGGEVDARADIYALGVMLYYCVAGKPPFHGPTNLGTMTAHLIQPIPPLQETRPDLREGPALDIILSRCLAKSVDDRFTSMAELANALSAFLSAEPAALLDLSLAQSVGPETAPESASAEIRSWIPTLFAAGVLLVTLVAVIVSWSISRSKPGSGTAVDQALTRDGPIESSFERTGRGDARPKPAHAPAPGRPAAGTDVDDEARTTPRADPHAGDAVDIPPGSKPTTSVPPPLEQPPAGLASTPSRPRGEVKQAGFETSGGGVSPRATKVPGSAPSSTASRHADPSRDTGGTASANASPRSKPPADIGHERIGGPNASARDGTAARSDPGQDMSRDPNVEEEKGPDLEPPSADVRVKAKDPADESAFGVSPVPASASEESNSQEEPSTAQEAGGAWQVRDLLDPWE